MPEEGIRPTRISVVLPTFNRCESALSCIESLKSQTLIDWELVVVDDSTDDRTVSELRRAASLDSRCTFIHNDRRIGLPASRNVGIKEARASLIQFLEDDVVMREDALELLYKTYIAMSVEHPNLAAVAPSRPWIGSVPSKKNILEYAFRLENLRIEAPCEVSPFTGLIRCNFVPEFGQVREVPTVHSCSLYRRSDLVEIGGYDETTYGGNFLYEEMDLNRRLRKAKKIFIFQPLAVMYHRHSEEGGCRLPAFDYATHFVVNHARYLAKNYGIVAPFMFLSFLMHSCAEALVAVGRFLLANRNESMAETHST